MDHSRSNSQTFQYRYRPNAATSSVTFVPTSSDYTDQSTLENSTSNLASTSLCGLKQEVPLTQAYPHVTSTSDSFYGTAFAPDFNQVDPTTFALAHGFQAIPNMASPTTSPWMSSNNSSTSDTCSGSWSSSASSMSFSPEPQYQAPYMEHGSWPPQSHNPYLPAGCISMQEAFPAAAMESEYPSAPVCFPQLPQSWQYQYMNDGLLPVYESTEYCSSSHGSPESVSDQVSGVGEAASTTMSRSDSLVTETSTLSSLGKSVNATNSASPQPRIKSQFEGQLLEFSTPVAQTKSNGSKSAALPCPLAAYGCTSSFISKNEWKRHINTQHLRLEAWLCDQCPKRENKREFNRKDLFIQHLKRMHPSPHPTNTAKAQPAKSKPGRSGSKTDKAAKSGKGDDLDPALLLAEQRCHITLRQPPTDSACLFCSTNFSGRGSWEARIEHVAKHMEQYKKEGREVPDPETWRADRALEQWLVSEGVVSKVRQRWTIA